MHTNLILRRRVNGDPKQLDSLQSLLSIVIKKNTQLSGSHQVNHGFRLGHWLICYMDMQLSSKAVITALLSENWLFIMHLN